MTNSRTRTNKPVIPFIQLYDKGTQTFTVAGEFHTWDTIDFKTSSFRYASDDDKIVINIPNAGYYEVTFECSFYKSGAGIGTGTSQLYKNGSAVEGAKAIGCSYDTGQGLTGCSCITLHFIIYLNSREYVQIKTTSSANSLISNLETSRLLIKFIPTYGWNNNSGGNMNYHGDIMR